MLPDGVDEWIAAKYPDKKASENNCNSAVRMMVNTFDGLTVQVGTCNGVYHCWCINTLGQIVDPTQKQFSPPYRYNLIASRFLKKHEIELSTGAIFLDSP